MNLNPALDRLRSQMSPDAKERAERIAWINSRYVARSLDAELEEMIQRMIEAQAAFDHSGYAASEAHKQRALFVIGDSGSGKSTAIRRLFSRERTFQPYIDDFGQEIMPAVSFDAPEPLTMKLFARTGLEAIGYPIERDRQENQMWDLFRDQIRERSVLWLHIDEMQHAIRSTNHVGIQKTADVVKSLLQMPDWPLNAIFSGVPSLAQFLQHEDKQLQNRCKVIRFDPLRPGVDTERLRKSIEGVICTHAEMKAEDAVLSGPFANRVMHATNNAFGTAIQFVREVIFDVLRDNREKVEARDFVKAYARFSGCKPDANIFTAADWKAVIPGNALKDYLLTAQRQEQEARRFSQNRASK
ncbi:TniB family NTP-binding protein [Roseibium sp. FZY0029]|uniref:TniB family NTP-binding protein n=1 Tax=Roseibium sp. FZY0029 TaxID=3116647 RepID=UPI002EBA749E|nr:TniB family NTP-binding protein [Roseibium sp. FZY0029]